MKWTYNIPSYEKYEVYISTMINMCVYFVESLIVVQIYIFLMS